MRQLKKQIALLERVDQLIRLKATGNPKQLAERLQVSKATIFRIIDTMKEMNAPIYYDLVGQSYVYTDITYFKCGFYGEGLDETTERNLSGGYGLTNIKQLLKF